MADERLEIEVVLDDGSIKKGFDKIVTNSAKVGESVNNRISGAFKNVTKSIFSVQGALVGLGAALGAALASRQFIQAANIQEAAINDLNSAISRSGRAAEFSSARFQAFASQLQATTTVGDEAILKSAALIQTLGNLSQDGLERATKAAVNLSAALNIDLNAATQLVGKAAAGNVAAFSRFGLAIQKGATDAETFANALDQLEKRFSGAAASKLQTFAGATTALSNVFGDLKEEIGFFITRSPTLIGVINKITSVFTSFIGKIKEVREGQGDIFKDAILSAATFGRVLNDLVLKPFELVVNTIKVGINIIKTGIQGLVAGVAIVLADFANLLGKNSKLAQNLNTFSESSKEVFVQFANDTATSVGQIGELSLTDKFEKILNDTEVFAASFSGKLKNIDEPLNNLGEQVSEVGIDISSSLQDAAKKGIRSLALLTQGLAKGKLGFKEFGAAVLGIIGDLSISIGSQLVAIGLGIEKLRASLLTLTGGPAIAAGLALIALGGLLKGFAGGAGGLGAPTAAGVTGGADGSTFSDTSIPSESVKEDKKTEVVVNIQGNVLDRRETGLEIIGVLNEFFDAQDGRVVTA